MRDLIFMKKIPHTTYVLLHLKFCGFGIGFGIGRKYRPIRVSDSLSGLNQNSGFGRSLLCVRKLFNMYTEEEYQWIGY